MYRHHKQRGFTIIELLFSMSFIAVLLIFVLTATLSITRMYNKGITLKQVNEAGAAVGSQLETSLKGADAPLSTATVLNGSKTGGRLCLGTYSFVWNLKGSTTNKYSGSSAPIGLVKVNDPDKAMCQTISDVPKDKASELILDPAGVQLELRNLCVRPTANSGVNYVYRVTYTLSTHTSDDSTLISDGTAGPDCAGATDDACAGGPGDEFCALNRFDFYVYARTGGSGKAQ